MEHNIKEKLYFVFNKDVILTSGHKRAIIHNLNNGAIYSIDENTKNILTDILNGVSIENALAKINKYIKREFCAFLDKLCSLSLGRYYNCSIVSGKILYKKVIDKKFDTVWLEITKKCNAKCIHCYGDFGFFQDNNELSINEWKEVINKLSDFEIKKIVIIGGEPLLNSHFYEIIKYVTQKIKDSEIVLYSNLVLLGKINRLHNKLMDLLQKNNVKVVTSIYSYDKNIHDHITKLNGSFDNTVKAIGFLKKNNIYIKANIVVMDENYINIQKTRDFIESITGRSAGLDIVRNVGNSKISLLPHFTKSDPRIMKKPNFKPVRKDKFIKNYSGNSCFQGKINITANGYISPCIMSQKFIDKNYNVKNKSINDILQEYLIPRFWALSKDKNKKCSMCEYRYVCKDCVPQNGQLYTPNIFCGYNPLEGEWQD